MKNKKFTPKDNRVLTEIYRRLNYFNRGNLETHLLIQDLPSEVKGLKDKNIVIHSNQKETPRVVNWYKLTPKGKQLFKNYIGRISEDENLKIFEGKKVINFNTSKKTG